MTQNPSKSVRSIVALIGMRGSGKTSVGRELAALLDWPFVDTDELVTKNTGMSIATIFNQHGEAKFRQHETAAIQHALENSPAVVSVGGGAVVDNANVELLRRAATVFWLTAPVDVLWERISNDPSSANTRPPLTQQTGIAELRQVLTAREAQYRTCAHHEVDASTDSPRANAERIAARLNLAH